MKRFNSSALLFSALIGLFLSSAEMEAQSKFAPQEVISASHGVTQTAAGMIGGGRDFGVRFHPGGFSFMPALGKAAPETQSVNFKLEEIRRGATRVLAADPSVVPSLTGDLVTYRRRGGIEERYEVRADGVHQSFLFPNRPEGQGDLIVRGRIDTTMEHVAPKRLDEGPLFELPGIGGVGWGAVTGIDADGSSMAGTVRLVGDVLEFVLPAAFIDTASYPLLLDPLIGTQFGVGTTVFDDGNPDVAYDGDFSIYLVVWQRTFSATHSTVRAQQVSESGGIVNSTIFLTTTPFTLAVDPVVASIDLYDRFLVAWADDVNGTGVYQIMAAAVDAFDGSPSNSITVSPSISIQSNPSIGGERTLVEGEAIIVWEESRVGIVGHEVHLHPSGDPDLYGSAVTIAANTTFTVHCDPSISRSAGDSGNHLVVWRAEFVPGNGQIFARAVDRNLNLLGGTQVLVSEPTNASDDTHAAVDGDGTHWVVAFERPTSIFPFLGDIVVRAVSWNGVGLTLDSPVVNLESDPFDDEHDPAVAWINGQALVVYVDGDNGQDDVRAKSIDPFACIPCETVFDLGALTGSQTKISVASQYSGGGSNFPPGFVDEALIVWESRGSLEAESDIFAIRYDAGTPESIVAGSCGSGGELFTPCAYDGNANFQAHLKGGLPSASVVLVLSLGYAPFGCGPCLVAPAFDGSQFTVSTTTDVNGDAFASVPIPAGTLGAVVTGQWFTFQSGGPCAMLPGLRLSNGLQTTVD